MLLNLMEADGLIYNQVQYAEQFYHYSVAATVLIWGILVDRFSAKRKYILLISNLIWIVGTFLLYFMQTAFTTYLIVQILWGIAFGANGPIIGSYLGDLFRINKRGLLFSSFTIMVYLIKASSIGVTGIIGNYVGNWKFPSILFGFLGIGFLFLFLIYLKKEEPKLASIEPEFSEKIEQGYEYQEKITWNGFKSVITQPTNLLFLLQGISGMIGVTIVTRYMNYWFTSDRGMGMDSLSASLILGAGAGIGALLGITLVGRWIDKQFDKGKINKTLYFSIICLFLQVIFYYILTLVLKYPEKILPEGIFIDKIFKLYPVFYYFIIVFNFCSFCGTPIGTTVSVARTHVNLPEHRGTAAALYDLFDFIGSGVALVIGVLLYDSFQLYQLTIFIGSCFWLISGFLWIIASKTIKKDYENVRKRLQALASEK
ncbi:MAG: MFS transporter [Promethearchaeota archaeon]